MQVAFDGSNCTLIDGPFEQTCELVAGFWLWGCKKHGRGGRVSEALPQSEFGPGEIEIRPMFEASDFWRLLDAGTHRTRRSNQGRGGWPLVPVRHPQVFGAAVVGIVFPLQPCVAISV